MGDDAKLDGAVVTIQLTQRGDLVGESFDERLDDNFVGGDGARGTALIEVILADIGDPDVGATLTVNPTKAIAIEPGWFGKARQL